MKVLNKVMRVIVVISLTNSIFSEQAQSDAKFFCPKEIERLSERKFFSLKYHLQ